VTHQPGPMKRPTMEPSPGHAMARFVLAEDAKAGDVLDLDLNTGKLVPARMAPLADHGSFSQVNIPADPPPGLFLRALVANWRQGAAEQDTVAHDVAYAATAGTARDVLDSVAGQLERTLDLMGVADLTPAGQPCGMHLTDAGPDAEPKGSLCFHGYGTQGDVSGRHYCRAGRPIQLASETEQVQPSADRPPADADWAPRPVLDALVSAWSDQLDRMAEDDPTRRTMAACRDMLAEAIGWAGQG